VCTSRTGKAAGLAAAMAEVEGEILEVEAGSPPATFILLRQK